MLSEVDLIITSYWTKPRVLVTK